MQKRGQVTVFVILGIVIVVILALVFYLYGERLKIQTQEQTKFDTSTVEPLKTFVQDCIDKYSLEGINLIGKQGGEINPGFYQNWNCVSPGSCDKVSYACYTTEYSACYNKKPFLKEFVQDELENYLKTKIVQCVDLNKIRNSGYTVSAGELKLNVSMGDYATIVNVNYPITITKGDAVLKQDKFSKTFDVPLGRLIKVASDIIDLEQNSLQGTAFFDGYLIRNRGEIEIERHIYRDTEIYITKLRTNPYIFQIAIQNYVIPFP
ncbi:MAG: hypothetical protein AABX61_01870 [Nanoarchaeota archaeon]